MLGAPLKKCFNGLPGRPRKTRYDDRDYSPAPPSPEPEPKKKKHKKDKHKEKEKEKEGSKTKDKTLAPSSEYTQGLWATWPKQAKVTNRFA